MRIVSLIVESIRTSVQRWFPATLPKQRMKNPGTIRFTGTIEGPEESWGGDGWVEFPHDLDELYGMRDWVPVVVTMEGQGFRTSLHPAGISRRPVVHICKADWRRLKKAAGERVDCCVVLDEDHGTNRTNIVLPPDLKASLSQKPKASATFKKLYREEKREYVYWIEGTAYDAARKRRIARAVEMIANGQRLSSRGLK